MQRRIGRAGTIVVAAVAAPAAVRVALMDARAWLDRHRNRRRSRGRQGSHTPAYDLLIALLACQCVARLPYCAPYELFAVVVRLVVERAQLASRC